MAPALRGERFDIDLSSDDERDVAARPARPAPSAPSLVKDVLERSSGHANPPAPPTFANNGGGFPAHKKRTGASRFKAQRNSEPTPASPPSVTSVPLEDARMSSQHGLDASQHRPEAEERKAIDMENRDRLANMSDAEIAKERDELMKGLSPTFLEMLLRRANIDETSDPAKHDFTSQNAPPTDPSKADSTISSQASGKTVRFEDGKTASPEARPSSSSQQSNIPHPSHDIPDIHFPRPPEAPQLDPSSPSFLEDLHEKYFPSLSSDPSKLAWMSEFSDSSYSPNQDSVSIFGLRFNFTGSLISPRTAEAIPVTKGLHHHGDAPASAGYTIPELARLARSSFPSQRCVAYQVLGRILYRLGRGELGKGDDKIPMGLWKCMDDGKVIDSMEEEVAKKNGHTSAKAYATEALWLWRKGGGNRWKAE